MISNITAEGVAYYLSQSAFYERRVWRKYLHEFITDFFIRLRLFIVLIFLTLIKIPVVYYL